MKNIYYVLPLKAQDFIFEGKMLAEKSTSFEVDAVLAGTPIKAGAMLDEMKKAMLNPLPGVPGFLPVEALKAITIEKKKMGEALLAKVAETSKAPVEEIMAIAIFELTLEMK